MGGGALRPDSLSDSGDECVRRLGNLARLAAEPSAETAWIVIASVAVVEAHVGRIILRLVDQTGVQATPLGRALVADSRDAFVDSWGSRLQWLNRGFGVALAGGSEYQSFNVLVQARNAILHGEGYLTERQVRRLARVLELKRNLRSVLGVETVGRQVMFSAATRTRTLSVSRTFVDHFDAEVLKRFPAAAIAPAT